MSTNRQHLAAQPVIARFVAEATDNTERVEILVREDVANGLFTVMVPAGCLSDGEDYFSTSNLPDALLRANNELMEYMLNP
jgi:hypothetical protein